MCLKALLWLLGRQQTGRAEAERGKPCRRVRHTLDLDSDLMRDHEQRGQNGLRTRQIGEAGRGEHDD